LKQSPGNVAEISATHLETGFHKNGEQVKEKTEIERK
jgi:hypothetical protein